jgi:hypothetical protein
MNSCTLYGFQQFPLKYLIDSANKLSQLKKDNPLLVIFFSPVCPEDMIMYGDWVDRLLDCKGWERGYIVPVKLRKEFYKQCPVNTFGTRAFIEREPTKDSEWL